MTRANIFTLSSSASKRLPLSKMHELLNEEAVYDLNHKPKLNNSKKAPILICAWCQSIEASSGNWEELDNLAQRERLIDLDAYMLTHGICPRCYTTTMNQTGSPPRSENSDPA